jgi:hypothetical protein
MQAIIDWLVSFFRGDKASRPEIVSTTELIFASEARKQEYEAQLALLQESKSSDALFRDKTERIASLVAELVSPTSIKIRAVHSDEPDNRHTYSLKLSANTAWLYSYRLYKPTRTFHYDSTKDTEQDIALMIATKILSEYVEQRKALGPIR